MTRALRIMIIAFCALAASLSVGTGPSEATSLADQQYNALWGQSSGGVHGDQFTCTGIGHDQNLLNEIFVNNCFKEVGDSMTYELYFRNDLGFTSKNYLPPSNNLFSEAKNTTSHRKTCVQYSYSNGYYIVCADIYFYQSQIVGTPLPAAKNLGDCSCNSASAGTSEGEPINAATGNIFESETDFTGGVSTKLSLIRYYNSRDGSAPPFGVGWHSNWHRALIGAPAANVTFTRADGREEIFTYNSPGTYTPDPDVTDTLSVVPATGTQTGWQITTADDTVEAYTLAGVLTSIKTRAGLTTKLSYDASNNLTKVTGPFGHTLNFTYDSSGRVITMTVPDGGVYAYSYDSKGNLSTVTHPDGSKGTYVYEKTAFPNMLTGIIDEDGNRFATWAYDSSGRAVSSEHAGGVDLTKLSYTGP